MQAACSYHCFTAVVLVVAISATGRAAEKEASKSASPSVPAPEAAAPTDEQAPTDGQDTIEVEETPVGQQTGAEDPCAKVSCAGHGNCLLKAGEPVCACAPNYMPDQFSGLNCVPVFSQGEMVQTPPSVRHRCPEI